VLVDRILPRETRIDEKVGQQLRIDLGSRSNLECGAEQTVGRADARQQRRGRRDDEARRPAGGTVQCRCARGRDAEVRHHAAIRIDLERRKGQHRTVGRGAGCALERGEEEPRVGGHLLDVLVRRHDEHRRRRRRSADARRDEGLRRWRQPGHDGGELIEAELPGRAAEQGAQCQ
jgi:hypothetical protein